MLAEIHIRSRVNSIYGYHQNFDQLYKLNVFCLAKRFLWKQRREYQTMREMITCVWPTSGVNIVTNQG